jgi:hypothetical protein
MHQYIGAANHLKLNVKVLQTKKITNLKICNDVVFLRLLVQLEKFQQYMVLPCMWCNFASCTISIGANIW